MPNQFVDAFIPTDGHEYHGGIAAQVHDRNFAGLHRPYLDKNNRLAVTVNTGRYTVEKGERKQLKEHRLVRDLVNAGVMQAPPVTNATALRKEEWLEMDRQTVDAAHLPMRAWSDLAAASTFGGFNGMSKLILEHETMNDPGEAQVDMDGLTEGRNDAPKFQLEGLPLPITHSDFWFSSRFLAVSRNSGTPLDVSMGKAAARRVGESVERTTIGIDTGITYGGNSTQVGGYGRTSKVYGYLNFTSRLTYTGVRIPTAATWTPEQTQNDFNTILNNIRLNKYRGPFMVYNSNDWDTYLDGDYYVAKTSGAVAPTKTLRNRLRDIDGIIDIRRLDFLAADTRYATDPERIKTANPFTLIFVQLGDSDVARAVNGMSVTTVQWESQGGMRLNFKVMCINVPQLRADFYGHTGVMQATTS